MSVLATQRPGYGPDTPVQIFQWEAEFVELLSLYRKLKPKRTLEVGTYHGGTLYHWLRNARSGARVVTVDSYQAGVDNRALYASWKPSNVRLQVIAGDSMDPATVARAAEWAPYDFLFIDAGHYYHEVRADWDNYHPLVRPGGIVALHDILPPSPEHPEIQVAQLWAELQAEGHETREIIANPRAGWGGIGVVTIP